MNEEHERHPFPYLYHLLGRTTPASAQAHTGCHPVLNLINAQIRDRDVYSSALASDRCIRVIQRCCPDSSWLRSKAQIALCDNDVANVAAVLGEIRAYGEILALWQGLVSTQAAGSDFIVNLNGVIMEIEVHSPHPVAAVRHIGSQQSGNVSFTTSEIFPFGYPERDWDNVQGEAVSKLAARKEDEHQFSKGAISVLWLDFHDPCTWNLVLGEEQFRSISCFREVFTSGAVWNAYYGRKGDRVHDHLTVTGMSHPAYEMEFDGRFDQGSKVNFVVFSTPRFTCVFQNHRNSVGAPERLWADFICLAGFRWELSWLDFPIAGTLAHAVEAERQKIAALEERLRDSLC